MMWGGENVGGGGGLLGRRKKKGEAALRTCCTEGKGGKKPSFGCAKEGKAGSPFAKKKGREGSAITIPTESWEKGEGRFFDSIMFWGGERKRNDGKSHLSG